MSSHFARLNTTSGQRIAVNTKAVRYIQEIVGDGKMTCKLLFGQEDGRDKSDVSVIGSLDEVLEKLGGHHHKDHHHKHDKP